MLTRPNAGGRSSDPAATAGGDPVARRLEVLKWTSVLGLVLFIALLEWVAWRYAPELTRWPGRLLLAVAAVVALALLVAVVTRAVAAAQRALERRNRELLALHHASLDIYGELSLDVVLQKVVDQTRELLGARYGALSVIDEDGRIDQFVTSGIDDARKAAIGDPPTGHGVLGVPLARGEALRLDDLARHPMAAGFPAHHPAMHSLLAMPITCKSAFRGNLYLANREGDTPFSADDEATLRRFADQVAIAIDNAEVHRRLSSLAIAEERARIAREMHDGMAQILAYANTKAQVVREHLRQQHTEAAAEHLEQLASAAREAYQDAREGILALRTGRQGEETLSDLLARYGDQWQRQSNVELAVEIDPDLELDQAVELQLLRIVQEALSNVRKHAAAGRATVEVRRDGSRIIAVVRDDGRGFDPQRSAERATPRFGLTIMRERAESVGGTLSIDSRDHHGTAVTVTVPAA